MLAKACGFPEMMSIFLRLMETSCMSIGPLLLYPCQNPALFPLGVPVVTASPFPLVFFVGRVNQCQSVVSKSNSFARCKLQSFQGDWRDTLTLIHIFLEVIVHQFRDPHGGDLTLCQER